MQWRLINVDVFMQISDVATIEKMIDEVLEKNASQLEAYRGGKTKLQGFFVGQVTFSSFCLVLLIRIVVKLSGS